MFYNGRRIKSNPLMKKAGMLPRLFLYFPLPWWERIKERGKQKYP